jgi:hypothetical protein
MPGLATPSGNRIFSVVVLRSWSCTGIPLEDLFSLSGMTEQERGEEENLTDSNTAQRPKPGAPPYCKYSATNRQPVS